MLKRGRFFCWKVRIRDQIHVNEIRKFVAQYNFVNPSPAYSLLAFQETHSVLASILFTYFLCGLRSRFRVLYGL
jgi:hypothetical protein